MDGNVFASYAPPQYQDDDDDDNADGYTHALDQRVTGHSMNHLLWSLKLEGAVWVYWIGGRWRG